MRITTAVLTLSITAAAVLIPSTVQAEPYKTPSKCGSSRLLYDTNDWNFFRGHKIRVVAAQCHNGTFIKYAKQPTVSFPSRPFWSHAENVTLAATPHIVDVETLRSGARKITWQFTARQKILELPIPQNFDIRYTTYPAYNQMCSVGGACDGREQDWRTMRRMPPR